MSAPSDLFLAILSMDSYDRSGSQTPAELVLPSGLAIGSATVSQVDDIGGDSFFAVVYSLQSGQTVISYRGTDDKNLFADPLTGWVTSDGAYNGAQAQDAAKLYLQLNGNNATPNSDFILTGDSLGGGLAGFVADIYSDEAVIFNNMPFEKAVNFLYKYTTQGMPDGRLDTEASHLFYNEPNDGVLVLQQPGQTGTPDVTEMFGGPGAQGFAALAQYDAIALSLAA